MLRISLLKKEKQRSRMPCASEAYLKENSNAPYVGKIKMNAIACVNQNAGLMAS
jgi:hypothetical protein